MKSDLEYIEVYSSFKAGFSWDAKEAWGPFTHFSPNRAGTNECFLNFVPEECQTFQRMSVPLNFFICNLKNIREIRLKIILCSPWSCFQLPIYAPAQTKAEGLHPWCLWQIQTSWGKPKLWNHTLTLGECGPGEPDPKNCLSHGNLMKQQLLTKPNYLLPEGKKVI